MIHGYLISIQAHERNSIFIFFPSLLIVRLNKICSRAKYGKILQGDRSKFSNKNFHDTVVSVELFIYLFCFVLICCDLMEIKQQCKTKNFGNSLQTHLKLAKIKIHITSVFHRIGI